MAPNNYFFWLYFNQKLYNGNRLKTVRYIKNAVEEAIYELVNMRQNFRNSSLILLFLINSGNYLFTVKVYINSVFKSLKEFCWQFFCKIIIKIIWLIINCTVVMYNKVSTNNERYSNKITVNVSHLQLCSASVRSKSSVNRLWIME